MEAMYYEISRRAQNDQAGLIKSFIKIGIYCEPGLSFLC